jgi:hypothetical protein
MGKFNILELNGLTGEPAHMYDPKHNVFYAWKCLMNTWKLSFQLGELNRENGFKPLRFLDFLRIINRNSDISEK